MSAHLVTIMFTDLVKSTDIKLKLPASDINARNRLYIETILQPHRQRVHAAYEGHAGRVVKTEGDAYFLVFDDPVHAVQCAMAIQVSHTTYPISTGTVYGDLQVKIGLHTGAPPPDPDDHQDFIGAQVDYAARVAALATGGQIVLSETMAALVRDAHIAGLTVHGHGERELKGIGRVRIFELLYATKSPQPLKDAALSPTNLPPPPDLFIGRADVLTALRTCLHTGGVAILKGEGGIGKTALVLVTAHTAHEEGELPGGVAWLNCALHPSYDECLHQMTEVLCGDRMEQERLAHCQARVMAHLQAGGALVILDNFETVADDVALLRWLAEVRAPAQVLITTRDVPFGLRGRVIEVGELPREEAVALFVERLARTGVTTTGQDQVIASLCAAVGDLPLAIELLAARAARAPLRRLLERVGRDLAVLEVKADPTRPDRHQSARACFALSYEHLSEAARALLQRLSVLPDGASAEVITAVMATDTWDEAAEELVAMSVWRLADTRYTIHPLVRQFVLEQLGHGRATAEHHAARTMTRLAQAKGALTTSPDTMKAALEWMETEWRTLLACADLAFAAADWAAVGDLADAVRSFFLLRGYWQDGEYLFQRALTARHHAGDRQGEGKAYLALGIVYERQGRWAEAEAAYQQSLGIDRELGDRSGEAQSLNNLGIVYDLQDHSYYLTPIKREPEQSRHCV